MSFRGRGRGRGRGGGGRIGPVLKDEDGKAIFPLKLEGPPPLFPKVDLPERPDITQKETAYIVEKRRQLQSFWNDSAYYVEARNDKSSGVFGDGIERYADTLSGSNAKRKSLSLYLQLDASCFPSELLGNQRRRKPTTRGGIWNLQNESKTGLGRLDKLAKLEQKVGEKGEGDEEKKGEDEEDEEDRDVAFDDEEEEDDYNKFEAIDDDEEYDFDEGGGDEDEGGTYM